MAHTSRFVAIDELAAKTSISKETAGNYLEALRALFLFDRVPSYAKGDYEISHYRDNRKREIDFLIERSDGALLGVEVKAGSVAASDFKHLKWFAENVARKSFIGIVIHSGKDVLPFGEGFYSVPFAALAE